MENGKNKSKGGRGFSLFTPLVGTAVVIIAILISITMIQNNLRISEGISDSYVSAEQSIGSQTIESAATGFIIREIEGETKNQLGRKITITECEDGSECTEKLKDEFDDWDRLKFPLYEGTFLGFIGAIETVTDYDEVVWEEDNCEDACDQLNVDSCPERFGACADIIVSSVEPISTRYNDEGRLEVDFNADLIKGESAYEKAFRVGLKNEEDDEAEITRTLIPKEATYTTTDLSDHIEDTEEAFDYLKDNTGDKELGVICSDITTNNFTTGYDHGEITVQNSTDGNVSLEVPWKNVGVDTNLHLEYKSAEYVAGDSVTCP